MQDATILFIAGTGPIAIGTAVAVIKRMLSGSTNTGKH